MSDWRLVILLDSGNYLPVSLQDPKQGYELISLWMAWRGKTWLVRLRDSILAMSESSSKDEPIFGVDFRAVQGMYMFESQPTPQDRIADALDRQMGDGDEWKEN